MFALETIVEKFGEEIAPFAVGLCQHLAAAFTRLLVRDSLVLGAPNAFNVPQRQAENVEVLRSVVSGRIGFVSLDLASKRDAPQLDALGLERAMPAVASPAIDLAHCDLPEQKLDLTGRPRGKRCTAGAFEPSLEVVRHTRWLRANPKR